MVTYDTIIKRVCQKEIENGCYEIKINGLDIYNYLKRYFRNRYLSLYGLEEKAASPIQSKSTQIKSIALSFIQIVKIVFGNYHYDNCFHSFRRVEKINSIYVDKFTDPLIDNSNIHDNYIIIEAGRNGKHYTPRLHSNHIVYADFFNLIALLITKFFYSFFETRNKEVFNRLFRILDEAFPEIEYSSKEIVKNVFHGIIKGKVYSAFYKKIRCKRLIAPSRVDFQVMIPAARENNMVVIELQHGITYAESLTYSGYQSAMFTPDVFLAFGDMKPKNVYGIDENNIHNIGFAFLDYIKDYLIPDEFEKKGVLLISEPSVTTSMVSVALKLAEKYPDIMFSFRPHPMEQLTQDQMDKIQKVSNIVIDDNTQNIMISLTKNKYVLGENSTALYEALSFGCLVGKLSMDGLFPKYLEEKDKDLFFEIKTVDDFANFLKCDNNTNNVKHIYSPYCRDKFEEQINTYNYE